MTMEDPNTQALEQVAQTVLLFAVLTRKGIPKSVSRVAYNEKLVEALPILLCQRPSLDLSPSNCRKAPLLSSPSMEAIRSPLLYSYEYLSMKDSSRLFLQRWKSLENNTKLVLVVHDVISYGSFACLRLIPTLVNSGYDLVTFDLRGHGRSTENEIEESNLQYLSGCETWSSDLHEVILHVLGKFETPERKANSLFLYGEGFGERRYCMWGYV
ncbi:hypothetical protein Gasu2_57760 [Galdieria sulphuraria]|nr:hypothetical protein Gasu2_57760 [Galdieria sulphuraria]